MGQDVVVAAVAVLGAVAAGLAVRRWLVFVTKVDSLSMLPTLAPGQRLLTRRVRRGTQVRRGDIVVARSAELGRAVVKRVLGLPGEQVVIGRDGRVWIDGRPVNEPYVADPGGAYGVFNVPASHLLLLGDNRGRSSDSRSWRQPFLPVSAVLGKVVPGPR